MSMHTAKRARLPRYKLTPPGHVTTGGGVQAEVRYYTRADVRIGENVFRHDFKVLEILPDVVLSLPLLPIYNPTANWKDWYADVRHRWTSYRLSIIRSRDSTQLQFQATSKLGLLLTRSSSSSKVSAAGSPATLVKGRTYLRSSTHAKNEADTLDDFDTEDSITDEECSDMET